MHLSPNGLSSLAEGCFFVLFVCFSNCFFNSIYPAAQLERYFRILARFKNQMRPPPPARPSLIVGTRVLGSRFTDSRLAVPRPR